MASYIDVICAYGNLLIMALQLVLSLKLLKLKLQQNVKLAYK